VVGQAGLGGVQVATRLFRLTSDLDATCPDPPVQMTLRPRCSSRVPQMLSPTSDELRVCQLLCPNWSNARCSKRSSCTSVENSQSGMAACATSVWRFADLIAFGNAVAYLRGHARALSM
jgi:hypothetical protein